MTNSGTIRKGPDAFRTISEVAEAIQLPQHVLRFWETRFTQIKPLKRAGGRRFYRPEDVELLIAIRHLLYGEGYTIRGVQRLLKEQGPRAVAALARGEPIAAPTVGTERYPDAGQDQDAEPGFATASPEAMAAADDDRQAFAPGDRRQETAFGEEHVDRPLQSPRESSVPSRNPAPSQRAERVSHPAERHLASDLRAVLRELRECQSILLSARGSD
jgi:DNA-binding transcriptional MerR regulator